MSLVGAVTAVRSHLRTDRRTGMVNGKPSDVDVEDFAMTRPSLTELANAHGSDKGTVGPTPDWAAHNYTDVYEAYLERHRTAALKILEIGLGVTGKRWKAGIVRGRNTGGASLKMWYDYFPNAQIYGIDVNECSYLDNDRVRTFVADQGNLAELEAFVQATANTEFDVIIDDGSHRPDHQQISLGFFFKRLKPGGLYFIEDLLANGMGDGARGWMACDSVRNTRTVLKHFVKHGVFGEPHALVDPDELRSAIDAVHFHVPRISFKVVVHASLKRPIKKLVSYQPDRETLCLLRKKA